MQIRFLSLANPDKTGFLINSETDRQPVRYQGCVEWAKAYSTLGDGLTQHTPERPIELEELADFLASTASYLLNGIEEERELVAKKWPHFSFTSEKIIFTANLRPAEEGKKTVYFYPSEQKTSTNEKKAYDRRWHEIPAWADGSTAIVYTLLCNFPEDREFRDTLTRYAIYDKIRDIIAERFNRYDEHPAVWIAGGSEKAREIDHSLRSNLSNAFESLAYLVQSVKAKQNARSSLGCYLHNTRKQEPEQTPEPGSDDDYGTPALAEEQAA